MDAFEKGKAPMPSVDGHDNPQSIRSTSRTLSTSICIPMNSLDSCEIENNFACKLKFVSYISAVKARIRFHNVRCGDAKGWARRTFSSLHPDDKIVQWWNKFFVISCLVAVFLDPLFFFLFSVKKDSKCIAMNSTMKTALVVFRSMTDFIYLLHMLLQFRVEGSEDFVKQPKRIALDYLSGYFLIDMFVVLPLPQILILLILPIFEMSSGANSAKNLLRASILIQYIPRLYRVLPMLVGVSANDFIFESVWANFVINLLTFVLSGHVVGSCWYLFGFQRVNQCLRDACRISGIDKCTTFIDCGQGSEAEKFKNYPSWGTWKNNVYASACIHGGGSFFEYGIYGQAVNLTSTSNLITRYVYSLFWGFQQISTLAGNQTPSFFVWEVLFTMAIIVVGLLLFALLIGNMQKCLEALGRRRLEMLLRRRDFKQPMRLRRLPKELRKQVRKSERHKYWTDTRRAVDEEMCTLLNNLPEDLQRDTRRHIFRWVKKIRHFDSMSEPILDAIHERLRQKTYIKGSIILVRGGLIDEMVFIVRGKLESIKEDENIVHLSEGDVCGEELLIWYLKHSSVNRDGKENRILKSNRTVKCSTNVEAFILRDADIEEVASLFPSFLLDPSVQSAISTAPACSNSNSSCMERKEEEAKSCSKACCFKNLISD